MNNKNVNINTLLEGSKKLPDVLKQLGLESLRKGQDAAIANIMAGKDTYVVLPTGMGKSAVFTIPTLAMGWKTIVFTPLVALMQDHTEGLLRKGLKAAQLSSTQSDAENKRVMRRWVEGDVDFLFIAPERLNNDHFKEAIGARKPNMVAVDEAHCLSQWGVNFRPTYCRIADFIKEINPDIVLTLTATAPKEVEKDIISLLGLNEDVDKVIYMPPRTNLHMTSAPYLGEVAVLGRINNFEGSGIVYCSTVKRTHELYDSIGNLIKGGSLVYNGQMKPTEKSANQEMWSSGEVRVAICTNAFGLGINKPDTRFVIFRDIPGSPEELVQGFGRAGRDGNDAWCVILNDPDSVKTQEFFINCGYPDKEDTVAFYNAIKQSSDSNGVCEKTLNELASLSGVSRFSTQAIMSNLMAFNVIERPKSEKTLQIRLLKSHPDPKYLKYFKVVNTFGIQNGLFFDIDLDVISQEVGLGPATVRKHLIEMDQGGYIIFVPPPKGKPIKIIDVVDKVDFDFIRERRKDAYKKLDLVKTFFHVPDDLKHEFLTSYFENNYGAKK